mmetsp:Transcript_38734/g.121033  ORF Transcript_38734/g.121033 Transcript_38734/m.121033 type:complete len:234 (-) Transcript_38734:193-894(-)
MLRDVPASPRPEAPEEPSADAWQCQRGLGQSESGTSILTAGSDGGPPATGPPQSSQSVFGHGEVLQPHLALITTAAQAMQVPAQTMPSQPMPMQMVKAIPTLGKAETGHGRMLASSPERAHTSLISAGSHPGVSRIQVQPMAANTPISTIPAARAKDARFSTVATGKQAAPTWVVEEVIDFGLDPNEGAHADREAEDAAFHRAFTTRVTQHCRGSIFETCTTAICADEDKERC